MRRLTGFPLLLLASAFCIFGCVPRHGSWIGGPVTGSAVMFAREDSPETVLQQQAKAAVKSQLMSSGFVVNAEANLRLDVALSQRNLDIVVHSSAQDGAGPAAARKQGGLFCKAKLTRLTIVLFDRARREVVYRGSAEEMRCRMPDVSQVNALVRLALAKLHRA